MKARLSLALAFAVAASTAGARAEATDAGAAPPPDVHAPFPPPPRVLAPPDQPFSYAEPQIRPTLGWFVAQLVPSPEIAVGSTRNIDLFGNAERSTDVTFGLRWQLAPVLWSWGLNRHLSPWRFLVVDPIARHSGSIELDMNFDWFFGGVDRVLVRPALRGNFPLFHRGEYLSMSLGTSAYLYDNVPRVAYEAGLYTLFGLFGVQATYAPAHEPLKAILTLRIRYF